jgi:hypothetical protein
LGSGPDLHFIAFLLLEFLKETVRIPENETDDNKRCYQQEDIGDFVFGIKVHPMENVVLKIT